MTDAPLTIADVVEELERYAAGCRQVADVQEQDERAYDREGRVRNLRGQVIGLDYALALLRRVAPEPTGEDSALLDALEEAAVVCKTMEVGAIPGHVTIGWIARDCFSGENIRVALREMLPALRRRVEAQKGSDDNALADS